MLDGVLSQVGVVAGGVVLALILLVVLTISRLIVLVPPNMASVITGRKRLLEEGGAVGYRTVMGGRTMRIPIIEKVQWLSLSTIPLELSVEDAYSKGNIPLAVKAVANVKIASMPEAVFNNAVERLLGKNISQIEGLARETLTGNLRGVLAKLTPEEVNEDRLGFAKHLSEEADHDLKKLGLQLDVLKIQHVMDRVGYLQAIGEKRTAEALRDAEIAKATAIAETRQKQAEAKRLAEVAQAQNDATIKQQQAEARMLSDVAAANANVTIAEAQNALRVRQAELGREAETAERVAKVAALKAETEAQTELEVRRVEREKTRLQADIVQPAEAARMAAEAEAKAAAAPILETGRAQAAVLRMLYAEIEQGGEAGLQVFLAEKLPDLLGVTVDAMKDVSIERLTVVDSGGGHGIANAATQRVNASLIALEQIAGAMGLDLERFVERLTGAGQGDGPGRSIARPDGQAVAGAGHGSD
ncbi:MAG: SPFH domain-containing protein [Gemmatimonadota bacterium]|jgi:flotillin